MFDDLNAAEAAEYAHDGDADREPEPWYPEFPGETRYAFCDNYEVHAPHNYRALNTNHYNCPGLTAENLALIEAEANQPPCEHGMNANLCAGPNHYPSD